MRVLAEAHGIAPPPPPGPPPLVQGAAAAAAQAQTPPARVAAAAAAPHQTPNPSPVQAAAASSVGQPAVDEAIREVREENREHSAELQFLHTENARLSAEVEHLREENRARNADIENIRVRLVDAQELRAQIAELGQRMMRAWPNAVWQGWRNGQEQGSDGWQDWDSSPDGAAGWNQ